MRLTLDTNVLLSAFVSRQGYPAKLVDIILTFPEIKLTLSEPILLEFRDVMLRDEVRERFRYSARETESFVKDIRTVASMIEVKSQLKLVKEDPNDDVVINTALDAKSDYTVSGDSHLLKIKTFRDIKIVSPKQMLKIIVEQFEELIINYEENERL